MFRTLIYPSSGACDCVDELPHRSSCSVKTDVLALVQLYGVWWCVWCDVFCRLVVVGRCILIDFDRYLSNKIQQQDTKYQTTNEKYHTQTNTMVTKHNR